MMPSYIPISDDYGNIGCQVSKERILMRFHPILVTSFLVVFGNKVTKILRNSLFIFHFVLPILSCKRKTSYRKSCNLSDEKPKTMLPKYVMCRAYMGQNLCGGLNLQPPDWNRVNNKFLVRPVSPISHVVTLLNHDLAVQKS